jgi:hypothetical protein
VFGAVAALQSARPLLHAYAHFDPSQLGVPVTVLQVAPHAPQFVTDTLVSHPSVFGALAALQSSLPAAQLYEHFVPSHVGVPVDVLHAAPQLPQLETLVFELSHPSRFVPVVALQSRSPAEHV